VTAAPAAHPPAPPGAASATPIDAHSALSATPTRSGSDGSARCPSGCTPSCTPPRPRPPHRCGSPSPRRRPGTPRSALLRRSRRSHPCRSRSVWPSSRERGVSVATFTSPRTRPARRGRGPHRGPVRRPVSRPVRSRFAATSRPVTARSRQGRGHGDTYAETVVTRRQIARTFSESARAAPGRTGSGAKPEPAAPRGRMGRTRDGPNLPGGWVGCSTMTA
jgi:hypothetical protein